MELDERVGNLEQKMVGVIERSEGRFQTIDEKLDLLLSDKDRNPEKLENKFVTKEVCKIVSEQNKNDIDNIEEKIKVHIDSHVSRNERYLYWIITTVFGGVIIAKLVNVF